MKRRIDYLGQPERLILEWEAPIHVQDRTRWAVGELLGSGSPTSFRYFVGEEFEAINDRRSLADAKTAGYVGFPAFGVHTETSGTITDGVAEAFARRLTPRARSDFDLYLGHHLLSPALDLTDMALLAATGARLPGDGFALTDPLEGKIAAQDLVVEIVGFRHYCGDCKQIFPDTALRLEADPANEYDCHALVVKAEGNTIGFVNRLQAKGLGCLLKTHDVTACVHRFNGTAIKPRAYAFVQVRAAVEQVAA